MVVGMAVVFASVSEALFESETGASEDGGALCELYVSPVDFESAFYCIKKIGNAINPTTTAVPTNVMLTIKPVLLFRDGLYSTGFCGKPFIPAGLPGVFLANGIGFSFISESLALFVFSCKPVV